MIRLRQLQEKDAEGMLEWMQDSEIRKSFRFCTDNKTKADVLEFIRNAEVAPIEGKSIHYAVSDDNDEYLGTISLKDVNLTARNGEYAISLRRKAQGKGIGIEATNELLRRAFCEFGFQKVYLNVLADNHRAIRLYEKCGFVYEGEFKGLKWYSMLREEYFIRQNTERERPAT